MIASQSKPAVAFFLPSVEAGGAERSIIGLANHVATRSIAVDLVVSEAKGPFKDEISAAVRLVDLSINGSGGLLGTTVRLARYLRENQPRTIMSSLDIPNVQLVLAARLARFKGHVVIGQRATIAAVYERFGFARRTLFRMAMRFAYPRANLAICNSSVAADEVRAIAGMQANRVIAIYNSVDGERINRLAKVALDDTWLAKDSCPLIVSVGSVTYLKDRSTLVRAVALVQDRRPVRLAIVGASYEPDEHAKVTRLIAELGLGDRIRLCGFDQNPYRWMKRAAVLVSSSLTEGCPNQILEGLSVGVPIVATDCPGGTSDVLERGKWGRLVPVGNARQMADAILAALDDASPADGRIRAADFSPSKVTSAYLDVLLPRAST